MLVSHRVHRLLVLDSMCVWRGVVAEQQAVMMAAVVVVAANGHHRHNCL